MDKSFLPEDRVKIGSDLPEGMPLLPEIDCPKAIELAERIEELTPAEKLLLSLHFAHHHLYHQPVCPIHTPGILKRLELEAD